MMIGSSIYGVAVINNGSLYSRVYRLPYVIITMYPTVSTILCRGMSSFLKTHLLNEICVNITVIPIIHIFVGMTLSYIEGHINSHNYSDCYPDTGQTVNNVLTVTIYNFVRDDIMVMVYTYTHVYT